MNDPHIFHIELDPIDLPSKEIMEPHGEWEGVYTIEDIDSQELELWMNKTSEKIVEKLKNIRPDVKNFRVFNQRILLMVDGSGVKEHFDQTIYDDGIVEYTTLVYLNEVDGGELVINDNVISTKKGRVVIFLTGATTPHSINKYKGERYVFVPYITFLE